MYRSADPAADWDRYCDDNPEMPGLDEIDEELYVSSCCGCEVTPIKKNVYICDDCGLFCLIDEEKTGEKALENWKDEGDEARAEAIMDARD